MKSFIIISFAFCSIAHASSYEELVTQAREQARNNENASSRQTFEKALNLNEGKRHEILREYADQVLFSNSAASAIPLFEEYLSYVNISQQERSWAEHNLALALAWSGRHEESIELYTRLLNKEPNSFDLRLNRAKVLTWNNQKLIALREYETLLQQNPNHVESRINQSELLLWTEQLNAAQSQLQSLLNQKDNDKVQLLLAQVYARKDEIATAQNIVKQIDADGKEKQGRENLLKELNNKLRPTFEIDRWNANRSDDTYMRNLSLRQSWIVNENASAIGVSFNHLNYSRINDNEVQRRSIGLFATHKMNEDVTAYVNLQRNAQRSENERTHDTTFDVYARYRYSDRLTSYFGIKRSALDELSALENNIRADYANLSFDYKPRYDQQLSLRLNVGKYSDENQRAWGQLEYKQEVKESPHILFGARTTTFVFKEQLNSGYWNPKRFRNVELLAQVWNGAYNNRLYYDVQTTIGLEKIDRSKSSVIWSARVESTYRISDLIEAKLYVGRFSSATFAEQGFASTVFGIKGVYKW